MPVCPIVVVFCLPHPHPLVVGDMWWFCAPFPPPHLAGPMPWSCSAQHSHTIYPALPTVPLHWLVCLGGWTCSLQLFPRIHTPTVFLCIISPMHYPSYDLVLLPHPALLLSLLLLFLTCMTPYSSHSYLLDFLVTHTTVYILLFHTRGTVKGYSACLPPPYLPTPTTKHYLCVIVMPVWFFPTPLGVSSSSLTYPGRRPNIHCWTEEFGIVWKEDTCSVEA